MTRLQRKPYDHRVSAINTACLRSTATCSEVFRTFNYPWPKQHEDIVKTHFKFHRHVIEGNCLVNDQVIYISEFYGYVSEEQK
jgi:hypothetical protein